MRTDEEASKKLLVFPQEIFRDKPDERLFAGISDPDIQKALGCTVAPPPFIKSTNIALYLEQFVATPPRDPGNILPCSAF
jgi:hypothetical protein